MRIRNAFILSGAAALLSGCAVDIPIGHDVEIEVPIVTQEQVEKMIVEKSHEHKINVAMRGVEISQFEKWNDMCKQGPAASVAQPPDEDIP